MIQLNDLSALILRVVEKGIVVTLSKVRDGHYSLYFGDHERSLRFMYHEEEKLIIQYADKEHPIIKFDDVDKIMEYVFFVRMGKKMGAHKNRFKIKMIDVACLRRLGELYGGYLEIDGCLNPDEYWYVTDCSRQVLEKSTLVELLG